MKIFKKVLSAALTAVLAFSGTAAFSAADVSAAAKSTADIGFITEDGNYTISFRDLGIDATSVTKIEYTLEVKDLSAGSGGGVAPSCTDNGGWSDQKEWGNAGSGKDYELKDGSAANEYVLTVNVPSVYKSHSDDDWYANFVLCHWWGGEPTVKSVKIFAGSTDITPAASAATTASSEKETQTITVSGNKKTFKATDLAKAAKTFSVQAIAKTVPSFTAKSDKTGNVSVDKKGKVTVKKGTTAGTYKISTKVTAKASDDYAKAAKKVTIKVVVK